MKHAGCSSTNATIVFNSRPKKHGIWRRRKCLKCHQRFTTREITEEDFKKLMSKKKAELNDLQKPMWAVISFRGVDAAGMTYDEAVKYVAEVKASGKKIDDLFITTNDAAERIVKEAKR